MATKPKRYSPSKRAKRPSPYFAKSGKIVVRKPARLKGKMVNCK